MRVLIYTDIPLSRDRNAGNINALVALVEYLSAGCSVDILSAHYSRPTRKFSPNVTILWRPDFFNLFMRKVRQVAGRELSLLEYKASAFKKLSVKRQLQRANYDLVIVEYVENAFLLDVIRSSTTATVICDIHDLMSQRAATFSAGGAQKHRENLKISRTEEIAALERFDAVVALQAVEAATIKASLPHAKVIVTRRPPPITISVLPARTVGSGLVLGFLGTTASFNVDAANRLLSAKYVLEGDVKYLIGGNVGLEITVPNEANCEILGPVDSLARFYGSIDVLANLVGFGSGLKTKNLEALAHGVPVITTSIGAEGMEDLIGRGIFLANSPDEFHLAVELLRKDISRGLLGERVRGQYMDSFAPERVFGQLDSFLRTSVLS